MKILLTLIIIVVMSAMLTSCGLFRYEEDIYTKTQRDTTYSLHVKNAPGNRDNGVIYPSSKVMSEQRYISQSDSSVERKYPDFIRAGVFESVGLLGGNQDYSLGTGLVGLHPSLGNLNTDFRGDKDEFMPGGLYRIGIYEHRLRWFRDAPGWTIGTSIYEVIAPDARGERTLISYLPIYIRKRYYLRTEIPYISWGPHFGIGYYPSQYINAAMALEIGSIGGLNLRAYAGLAVGTNQESTNQIKNNDFVDEAQSITQPYFGIGVSLLDFRNVVPELYTEYKYHEHSSWYVGWGEFAMLSTNAKQTTFSGDAVDETNKSDFINGFMLRFLNAAVSLPFLEHKVYAGTSLINFISAGKTAWGIGILPIRAGIWYEVLKDELALDPFVEYNYYPSSFWHLGLRANLRVLENMSLYATGGYATGRTLSDVGEDLASEFGVPGEFSNSYFGFGINFNRVFFEDQLRYFRDE